MLKGVVLAIVLLCGGMVGDERRGSDAEKPENRSQLVSQVDHGGFFRSWKEQFHECKLCD